MPKKISPIASATRATGFVTANNLADIDEKEVRKEVRISKNIKNSSDALDNQKHPKESKESRSKVRISKQNKTPPQTKQVRITSATIPPSKRSKKIQDLLKAYKRSTNRSNTNDSYLSIIALLNCELRPSEICSEAGVPKTTLQSHLNALKARGDIYKAGYGTWEVTTPVKTTKKRSTKTIHVTPGSNPTEIRENLHMFVPNSVRAHAFMFKLSVPRDLRNWTNEKRELYLDRKNIPYTRLGIAGGGQRLVIEGRITHLTKHSVIIYDKSSYFAETPLEAKTTAVYSFFKIVKSLERLLSVEFSIGSDYKFTVSKQHVALVQNALAMQCNEEGLQLHIRSEADNSLWALVDNSLGCLHEFEAVHPDTATTDAKFLQDFFNSARDNRVTPGDLLNITNALLRTQVAGVETQAMVAENAESHIKLIKDIGVGVKDLSVGLQIFNNLLEKLFKKLGDDDQ